MSHRLDLDDEVDTSTLKRDGEGKKIIGYSDRCVTALVIGSLGCIPDDVRCSSKITGKTGVYTVHMYCL